MRSFPLFILTCMLCAGQFVSGQEPIYNWGPPNTNDFTDRQLSQMLALGDDGFVLLRQKTDPTFVTHYWLEFYDANLQLHSNNEVAFSVGVMGDSYDLERIEVVNGSIYAFVSHWDKKAQRNSFHIQSLGLNGELTELAELDVITAQKMGNRGMFKTSFSPDGSKLLVLSEQPFVKKTQEQIQLKCFEVGTWKLNWEQAQTLDFPSSRAYHNHVQVTDKGDAVIFKKVWQKPEWVYAMYTGNADTWNATKDLGLSGKEVLDHQLVVDNAGMVVLYATWSIDPSSFSKKAHGAMMVRVDPELNLRIQLNQGWGEAILTHFVGENAAQNERRAMLEDFHVKDIIFRNDGAMLVLMERMKYESNPIAGSSPIQYTYHWNYGDFLALCYNVEDGSMNWWQTFQKPQSVQNNQDVDPYGSFVYHLKEDRLYVLWNNTGLSVPSIPPANWTEPDGTRYVKHKAFDEKTVHATFMHVIEPNGILAYEHRTFGLPLFGLHSGAVFEMSLFTPFFFEINGNLVVMAAMHNGGKRYRFGFIDL